MTVSQITEEHIFKKE